MNVPEKNDPFWSAQNGFLDPDDWKILETIIDRLNIKNVVEFGSGISTRLFHMKGLNCISFEQHAGLVKKARKNKYVVRFWDDVAPLPWRPDMVFIDAPWCDGTDPKYPNREESYIRTIPMHPLVIAVHDYGREEERQWIAKYLIPSGYHSVDTSGQTELFII